MIKLNQIVTEKPKHIDAYLTLPMDSRVKSRLKVTLNNAQEAGIFLPRGHILRNGDILQSQCGLFIEIQSANETVSSVHCEDRFLLNRIIYHLGNRHVPLQIATNWVRYQHDHVLDDMVKGLGGKVIIEEAPFEPEPGAYGGHTHSVHHSHTH